MAKGTNADYNYKLLLNPKPKWNSREPPPPSGQRYTSYSSRRNDMVEISIKSTVAASSYPVAIRIQCTSIGHRRPEVDLQAVKERI